LATFIPVFTAKNSQFRLQPVPWNVPLFLTGIRIRHMSRMPTVRPNTTEAGSITTEGLLCVQSALGASGLMAAITAVKAYQMASSKLKPSPDGAILFWS